jgi:ubiquinone/menaquinone biosynthesis C-methylase UbiE
MLRAGRFFQAVALPYDLITRHAVWERHCAQMATELPEGAQHVLDLGCGPGGADYAMSMLRRARRRDPRLALSCMDAGALPIRSGSLDAVTFHSVLYLLPDQRAALREVARSLRPGGRAVLLEPLQGATATAKGLLRALPSLRWAICAAVWRTVSAAYGQFTPERLRERLEEAGLRVVKLEEALGGLALLAVAERP